MTQNINEQVVAITTENAAAGSKTLDTIFDLIDYKGIFEAVRKNFGEIIEFVLRAQNPDELTEEEKKRIAAEEKQTEKALLEKFATAVFEELGEKKGYAEYIVPQGKGLIASLIMMISCPNCGNQIKGYKGNKKLLTCNCGFSFRPEQEHANEKFLNSVKQQFVEFRASYGDITIENAKQFRDSLLNAVSERYPRSPLLLNGQLDLSKMIGGYIQSIAFKAGCPVCGTHSGNRSFQGNGEHICRHCGVTFPSTFRGEKHKKSFIRSRIEELLRTMILPEGKSGFELLTYVIEALSEKVNPANIERYRDMIIQMLHLDTNLANSPIFTGKTFKDYCTGAKGKLSEMVEAMKVHFKRALAWPEGGRPIWSDKVSVICPFCKTENKAGQKVNAVVCRVCDKEFDVDKTKAQFVKSAKSIMLEQLSLAGMNDKHSMVINALQDICEWLKATKFGRDISDEEVLQVLEQNGFRDYFLNYDWKPFQEKCQQRKDAGEDVRFMNEAMEEMFRYAMSLGLNSYAEPVKTMVREIANELKKTAFGTKKKEQPMSQPPVIAKQNGFTPPLQQKKVFKQGNPVVTEEQKQKLEVLKEFFLNRVWTEEEQKQGLGALKTKMRAMAEQETKLPQDGGFLKQWASPIATEIQKKWTSSQNLKKQQKSVLDEDSPYYRESMFEFIKHAKEMNALLAVAEDMGGWFKYLNGSDRHPVSADQIVPTVNNNDAVEGILIRGFGKDKRDASFFGDRFDNIVLFPFKMV